MNVDDLKFVKYMDTDGTWYITISVYKLTESQADNMIKGLTHAISMVLKRIK